jgi:ABC transport system ATP-binding/permease protein
MATTLISLVDVSKDYPERRILSRVSFGVEEGDRLGIIGVNGAGKSTLLGVLAGQIEVDAGEVVRAAGTRVAYLRQNPSFEAGATIGSTIVGAHQGLAILDRLGIRDLDLRLGELSGGQLRRVWLAAALAVESEVLILDEPTNHLDTDAIDWLEDELDRRPGAVVIVTHDRYLLDRITTRVLEVEEGTVFAHRGGYHSYLEARALREAQELGSARKRANLARIELEWLNRRPKARSTKAKARVDRAVALLEAPPERRPRSLEFEFPSARLGSKVVEVDGATVRFSNRAVLASITWRLAPGARIGLVGPNGAGKTTLLRLLGGRLLPDEGSVSIGETVRPGWFDQQPRPLPGTTRILDVTLEEATRTRLATGLEVSASQLLQRFGFPTSQHSATVGDLSGGERRRFELMLVLASAPNLLLLDEPTNDLDLDTLGALEAFLDEWPGVTVIASHDRYLLDRSCQEIVSIEPDGSIRHHPGGYTAYVAHRRGTRNATQTAAPPIPTAPLGRSASPRPNQALRREYARLEADMLRLQEAIDRLTTRMEASATEWEEVAALAIELDQLRSELTQVEHRWLELTEVLEG